MGILLKFVRLGPKNLRGTVNVGTKDGLVVTKTLCCVNVYGEF